MSWGRGLFFLDLGKMPGLRGASPGGLFSICTERKKETHSFRKISLAVSVKLPKKRLYTITHLRVSCAYARMSSTVNYHSKKAPNVYTIYSFISITVLIILITYQHMNTFVEYSVKLKERLNH